MRVHILQVVSSPVFVPLFVPVISEVNARVPFASFRVYVLLAVAVFVKNEVNVFATLRRPKVVSRNVFSPLFICVEARTISHAQTGNVEIAAFFVVESALS